MRHAVSWIITDHCRWRRKGRIRHLVVETYGRRKNYSVFSHRNMAASNIHWKMAKANMGSVIVALIVQGSYLLANGFPLDGAWTYTSCKLNTKNHKLQLLHYTSPSPKYLSWDWSKINNSIRPKCWAVTPN